MLWILNPARLVRRVRAWWRWLATPPRLKYGEPLPPR